MVRGEKSENSNKNNIKNHDNNIVASASSSSSADSSSSSSSSAGDNNKLAAKTCISSDDLDQDDKENKNNEFVLLTAVTAATLKQEADDKQQQDNNNAAVTATWDNLPSVILLEIFSYLPHTSRITASQVCRHWRYTLFHPSFWKIITFTLKDHDSILWSRCLSSWFKFSVQEATIRCESSTSFVKEALTILKKLSSNRQLRKLYLEPATRCMFEYQSQDDDPKVNLSKKIFRQILNIVESNNLECLALGCVEEFTENLSLILEPLRHTNITQLSLASVKDDPDGYEFCELDCSIFSSFPKLSILSIDYDHVSDEFLRSLNSGLMSRLVIHVHGWNRDYLGASDVAWRDFAQRNPNCELRLSLIHSYNAVRVLHSEILQPGMPLTHLKVLFCEGVNLLALHQMPDWYGSSLRSIVWVDSRNSQKNVFDYDIDHINNPDPLVLAAWRCKNLREIVFLGSKYLADNLLAIVRLRSNTLQRLEFTESDILYDFSERDIILDEVREVMGKDWKLLSDQELPKVVINPLGGDSRDVIMPMVLRDQK